MIKNCRALNLIIILSSSLSGCLYGYNIGAMSGVLLFVQEQIHISHKEASFFVSTFLWGIVAAMVIMDFFSEKIGRKKIIFFGAILEITSILFMATSQGIYQLMIWRLIIGVACGLLTLSTPIYLAETLPHHVRGRGTVAYQVFITFGILFATIACWYYAHSASWRAVIYIELLPATTLLFISIIIPESPRWLALQKREQEALFILMQTSSKSNAENILHNLKEQQKKHQHISHLKAICKREFLLPLILAILLGILNQLTGINAFLQYDAVILLKSGFHTHDLALTGSLLIAGLNFLMTIPSLYFADHIERKKLLRYTLIGVIICLFCLSLLSSVMNDSATRGTLVTIFLLGFIACFAAGPGALIWTLRAELLPAKIRSMGLSISLIIGSSAGAIFSTVFLSLQHYAGLGVIFLFCAGIAILYFGLTYILPKTTKRSLEEIEKNFHIKETNQQIKKPPIEAYSIFIRNKEFFFEVYQEEDLTKQQHNELQKALNLAYGFRTKTFATKDFAYTLPKIRILCRHKGKLVGHTAIFEKQLTRNKYKVAGIGLTFNLMPNFLLGFVLRKKAAEIASKMGCFFGIGRIKNTPKTKAYLQPLVVDYLDIPLIGESTTSHNWETLAIYDTGHDKQVVQAFLDTFKKEDCLQIIGEIF